MAEKASGCGSAGGAAASTSRPASREWCIGPADVWPEAQSTAIATWADDASGGCSKAQPPYPANAPLSPHRSERFAVPVRCGLLLLRGASHIQLWGVSAILLRRLRTALLPSELGNLRSGHCPSAESAHHADDGWCRQRLPNPNLGQGSSVFLYKTQQRQRQ